MTPRVYRGKAAPAVLALLVSCVLLAACGGSSKGSSTSATQASTPTSSTGASSSPTATTPAHSAVEAALAPYRECIKKQGITLPKGNTGSRLPSGVTRAQYEAAAKKCHVPLGVFESSPTGPRRPITSAARQRLIKFAACMRENGVNLPPSTPGRPLYYPSGVNLSSAQFRAALLKCFPLTHGASKGATPGSSG
jgi:hypothetical protein